MIEIIQGFKLSTKDAIDNRILLSKTEMCAIDDRKMPERYFAVCKDDGYLYLYNKAATPNSITGKFVLYASSAIESISVNGYKLHISEDKNVDLPLASKTATGLVTIGNGLKINDTGFLTLDFNSADDDFKGSLEDFIKEKAPANDIIVKGYYYDNNFYTDQTHTYKILGYGYKIYIDLTSNCYAAYSYDETNELYNKIASVGTATSTTPGLVKLYTSLGENEDGTMTQKAISNEIGKKFEVDVDEDTESIIFT